MRKFRQRPMFAVLVVLAVLLAAPLAYAVVNRVFLRIDPDKTAPEIEQDVKSQLDQAGVPNAEVHAEKSDDGKLKLEIRATGAPGSDVEIVAPQGANTDQMSVRVEIKFEPTPAQMQALTDVMASDAFTSITEGDLPDDQRAAAIKQVLADHGFDADVTVQSGAAHVSVTGAH